MSSNVVAIDQRAHAREVSAEVRRQQLAERSDRVVGAIKRNRRARMMATKRWWLTVTGVTALVSVSLGAGAAWWWQQSSAVSAKTAVAVLPIAKPQEVKATQPLQPAVVAAVQPVTPAPAPIQVQPVEASSMGRLPSGAPGNPNQPHKTVHPAPASKPAGRPAAPLQEAQVSKDKPSTTQYEAPAANVSKPAIINPLVAAVPVATPAPAVATTSPYQVVGVPVDGVLQIKIGKDPAIKHIRIGERLPSGEVLRKANSETGQVDTSERSFKATGSN